MNVIILSELEYVINRFIPDVFDLREIKGVLLK